MADRNSVSQSRRGRGRGRRRGADDGGPSSRREATLNRNEERRNHSLVCVGHGEDKDGTPFWLMKNNWGPNWGENGFLRMAIEPGRQNFDIIVPT